MGYRDILLYLDPNATNGSFIDAVAAFASARGARLTGLYAVDVPAIPNYAKANLPRELLENHRKSIFARAEEIREQFQSACSSADLSFEWRQVEGETEPAVSRAGRYADLLVLSGGAGVDAAHGEIAHLAMLGCGRPVLVIPATAPATAIGTRVIIAWNARKEAARAVHDALPLLREAVSVNVVSINPVNEEAAVSEHPERGLGAHLSRHGVDARLQSVKKKGANASQHLLDRAAEEQADLIVMGGYGHARWRELVLGGVTAQMLRHTTVPLLISH
ncbi:MAG: universal stress protein [Gammaproteobacteria bacterium]|nr:universal stress protein [Gammaproteobacteria bacterium]